MAASSSGYARTTGITRRAIRKDAPLEIMAHAGHDDFKTTQRYIRDADALRAGIGDVFPALPRELESLHELLTPTQSWFQVFGII